MESTNIKIKLGMDQETQDRIISITKAKEILRENGYFVFNKAEEGDFPDMTEFKGGQVYARYDEKDNFNKVYIKAKFGKRSFKTDCGTLKEVRPSLSQLVDTIGENKSCEILYKELCDR